MMRYGLVLREVGRLLAGGTVASLGSGQLLERFAVDGDDSAFEALVSQHGPMVLGTCRRMLSDPHDVDDAFQATFLVLARKAGSIRDADRLGPWLHGVARRVASRSRALSARRNARERPGAEESAVEPPNLLEGFELRAAIDEELSNLPEKYRAPLVLCYLEGLTHDEAARQLRWPVGTVRSRLAGGRDRLRARLTRRGLAPSAAVPAIAAQVPVPQALFTTTIRVATSAGSAPAHVANLAKGALVAMMWGKLKMIAAVGLAAGLTVGGAGVAAQQGGGGKVPKEAAKAEGPDELSNAGEPTIQEAVTKLNVQAGDVQKKLDDANKKILMLTAELQSARSESQGIRQKLDALATQVARGGMTPATPEPDASKKADAPRPKPANPTVLEMGGPHVLVIPAELDRVTILNTVSGARATHRLPEGLTEIVPIIGPGSTGLLFRGPEVRQIATVQDGKWYPQDLKEPTTEASPIVGPQGVTYYLGRFFYNFSSQAKKWGVLELKRDPRGRGGFYFPMQNGKILVPEGDVIHVYDAKTGDWTHNDTKGPDKEARAQPDAPPPAPPAPSNPAPPPTPAQPPAQPIVHTLGGNGMNGQPPLFMVISPERDRVTMIDSNTKERSSFRLPKGVSEITPVEGLLISLNMKGPGIARTALYDRKAKRWYEHDLKEPAKEVIAWSGVSVMARGDEPYALQIKNKGGEVTQLAVFDMGEKKWVTQDLREPAKDGVAPAVTPTTASYRVGRFVHVYSVQAKKWSVLELKRADSGLQGFGGGLMPGLPPVDNTGKMVLPEGDVIHIYDVKSGEWTQVDTRDDK